MFKAKFSEFGYIKDVLAPSMVCTSRECRSGRKRKLREYVDYLAELSTEDSITHYDWINSLGLKCSDYFPDMVTCATIHEFKEKMKETQRENEEKNGKR
jgi:hypothetical protein